MKDIALLKQYLKSISKYSRITQDEEKDLAFMIRKGDLEAKEKLVNANLKLVVKIALDLYRGSVSIMDIIQNGNIGLIKAAEKFNPDMGVKFSTYSAFWIKQSILRGFVKTSLCLSISYRKDEINKKIKNHIRILFLKNGKIPAINVIAGELKVKKRDVIDVIMLYRGSGEFQGNNSQSDATDELIDMVQDNSFNPECIVEQKKLKEDINSVIESFPVREREIIKERYGFINEKKETLNKLGNKYAISAEATRQIEKKVLSLMKLRFPYLANYYYA